MRKYMASDAPDILNESNEEPNEQLTEEEEDSTEDPSEESVSWSSSDSHNHGNGKPNEEPGAKQQEQSTELSEDPISQPSADNDNDMTEHQSKELTEATSRPSGGYVDDSEHKLEFHPIILNEKKRELDAIADDSIPLLVFPSEKKCKREQFLESDDRSSVTEIQNKSKTSKAFVADEHASEQQEHTGSSGKRRRSRWDPQPENEGEADGHMTSKKKKTRWDGDDSQIKMLGPIQLPDFVKESNSEAVNDPEIKKLKMRLIEINRKLQGSEIHDDRPEEERSPSPPPLYDNFGIRINSRDIRSHQKLIQERQCIVSMLIQKNPTFKPPSDYKPPKLYRKLYIPLKEYPGYNFIGLILGPRGNTQKRMEKRTGARIVIRGRGSVKDGKAKQKPDPSDNDDLHVLVEADDQKSLDAAVTMVEDLLNPVSERMNEHKRAQLQELAELNAMVRDVKSPKVMGEQGHEPRSYTSGSKYAVACDTCGSRNHATIGCPLTASAPGSHADNQYRSFLADLGGGMGPNFSTSPISGSTPHGFSSFGFGTNSCYYSQPSINLTPHMEDKYNNVDERKLYVGCLPQSVDENKLFEMFSPFGRLTEAKVIKERTTGLSKGYGFVRYDDPTSAARAVTCMNGRSFDGRMLAVRVASCPVAVGSSVNSLPKYEGPSALFRDSPSQTGWPGPPGSLLTESQTSCFKGDWLGFPHSSTSPQHGTLSKQFHLSYGSSYDIQISSPVSFAKFPGNPNYGS